MGRCQGDIGYVYRIVKVYVAQLVAREVSGIDRVLNGRRTFEITCACNGNGSIADIPAALVGEGVILALSEFFCLQK